MPYKNFNSNLDFLFDLTLGKNGYQVLFQKLDDEED